MKMKAVYPFQFINELQHLNTTIKTTTKQSHLFLSKLLSIDNAKQNFSMASTAEYNIRPRAQQLIKAPDITITANNSAETLVSRLRPIIKEFQLNSEAAGTVCRRDGKRAQSQKNQTPLSPYLSGKKPNSQLQTLQLRPQIAIKNPTINPVKKRRAPLPPLTPELIARLEQTIKSDASTAIPSEKRQPPPRPVQPSKAAKLKMALKDFSINPEMARDKWGLSNILK